MGIAQGLSEPFERFEYTRGYTSKFIAKTHKKRAQVVGCEEPEPPVNWREPLRHIPQHSREIIKDVCRKHSVTPRDLMGPSRVLRIVSARNEAVYRIKEAHPNLSCPQIGKWFRKDHTSIIHSLARHSETNNLPRLTTYDIRAVDERNRVSAAKSRTSKD